MEQLLFTLILLVLIAGFGSLLKLSFELMQMQKMRQFKELYPELAAQQALEAEIIKPSLWDKLSDWLIDRVPVEKEQDILLDHNYDGVMELDNNLPPWWKGVFYITIAIAPVYLYFNHFSDFATSSREAYALEMEQADVEVRAYLATQSNMVDETTVVFVGDDDALSNGAVIFEGKCVACHGKLGEGGIGPNLTDDFWIHGGSIADIFKTVKYGVPEMGMIPWKNELRPSAIQNVSSFIMTLRGTDPPNAKEPQGERYVAEEEDSPAEEEIIDSETLDNSK